MNKLDDLFNRYKETKDLNILIEIAPLLIKGERPDDFINSHLEDYNKITAKMVKTGLIGKEKNGAFTEKESARTILKFNEKGLVESYKKTSGSAKGFIATSSKKTKNPEKKAISYMIKEGSTTELLLEVTGARFYQHFAGALGSTTAKTRLVNSDTEGLKAGSRMVEDYSDFWKNKAPTIDSEGRVMSGNKEIKGYIANLVVAKFIQDFDALGYGPNLGFHKIKTPEKNRDLHSAVKIDPGNSFGFVPKENGTTILLGVETNINNVITKEKTFNTTLPLDFIDPNNPLKLREELGPLKDALEHVHPNFDTRDLLMDGMTYAEISQHQKPYTQMAKTLEAIAKSSDETLHQLVYENMPSEINENNVENIQFYILEQLKTRRDIIKELYAQEIEYAKLYRQEKSQGHEIDFEGLKAKAAENTKNSSFKAETLTVSSDFQEEIDYYSKKILLTALSKNDKGKTHDINLAEKMMFSMVKHNSDFSRVLDIINEQDEIYNNEFSAKRNTLLEHKETFRDILLAMPDTYPFKQDVLSKVNFLITPEERKINKIIQNLTNHSATKVKLNPELNSEISIPNELEAKKLLLEMVKDNQDISIPLYHIPKENLNSIKGTLEELRNNMEENYPFKNKFLKAFPELKQNNIQEKPKIMERSREKAPKTPTVDRFRKIIEQGRSMVGIKGLLNMQQNETSSSTESISDGSIRSSTDSIGTDSTKSSPRSNRVTLEKLPDNLLITNASEKAIPEASNSKINKKLTPINNR